MKVDTLQYKLRSFSDEDLDSILDKRDSSKFEKHWLDLAEKVEPVELNFEGEERFVKLSQATGGHEICSYIIEDIELIEKAIINQIDSPFLSYLIDSYKKGAVPYEYD